MDCNKIPDTVNCEDDTTETDGNGNQYKHQLLIDLHRQFAENNNSILGSAITLLVAALGVLAGYGYVFLNTYNEWDCDLWTMKCCSGNYTLNALYFTALAVTIILLIMIYVFVYQGIAGRKEQFIVYAIRHKLNLNPG